MRKAFFVVFSCINVSVWAQLPASHLFHFKLESVGEKYSLTQARWLNQFNPSGYNDQPYFINDDEVYVTVQFPWDTTQTDIYSLNLASKVFLQITNTPESEYSAKLMPESQYFTVVRVDKTEAKTQRLWRYPLDRSNRGNEVTRYHQGIGYYHWYAPQKAMMFMVENPQNRMIMAEMNSGSSLRFEFNPGRSFAALSDGTVACIEKAADGDWYIKKVNPTTYASSMVIKTLPYSEDFVVTPEGAYLMGKGPYLYQYMPGKDQDWVQIANLQTYGVKRIERLALNRQGDLIMVTR